MVTFATVVSRLPVGPTVMLVAVRLLVHFLILIVIQITQVLHACITIARRPIKENKARPGRGVSMPGYCVCVCIVPEQLATKEERAVGLI